MFKFNEIEDLLQIKNLNHPLVHFETLEEISIKGKAYPIHGITIGSKDKTLPTLGLIGGVHGLERIGSQIIISFLQSLLNQLNWDKVLYENFSHYRIVCIPILNPGGMVSLSRCNPNNVDLMRNAPVEATGKTLPLLSGHRISPHLPWYRGSDGVLEKETKVLIKFLQDEVFSSKVSIVLDIHSGFGIKDQIWYPFAKSQERFPLLDEVLRLKDLLDRSYPHHIYKIEPQSQNYMTHGDLWDYLFELHAKSNGNNHSIFLPLTLELGSWSWIKKNPLQFFSKLGLFHPIKEHRHSRIMRRHLNLLDFLMRATRNHDSWL
jgi:hypothetical protein